MNNTISIVVGDGLCVGCGTCVSFCSRNALRMILDSDKGIFLPVINDDKCNKCGICYKVCPGHEVDFDSLNQEIFCQVPEDPYLGNYKKCYTGYSTNEKIRFNSSSGGLVTQFLIFALREGVIDGALVTRMNKNNPFMPEPFIARTPNEIIEASKSKYCPVPTNVALKKILNAPKCEKFAVVGLPCHIQGIRKAETQNKNLKNKIRIHLGIMCGTNKNFNGTIYQLKRMKIPLNKIEDINYRGEGWPGKLKITLNDGQIISDDLTTYYDGEFCSFVSWRCSLCVDHVCELSDISFGDAWIDEIKKVDKNGTSIIVSKTELSENLLEKLYKLSLIELKSVESMQVVKSQNMCSFKKKEISSRSVISRFLGKKLPVYKGIPERSFNGFSDYMGSILFYFQMYVSSKRYLWSLFKFQRIVGRIIHRKS